jgi:hypothetical protein
MLRVMAQHYKDLIAWQKAMDLVAALYDATEAFPKRETYSLTDQMRRAAVSIPSNIAEGQAHYSNVSFVTFFVTPVDPWLNSRRRYSLRNAEIT